jgi:RNA polymerase sigma-54 factor
MRSTSSVRRPVSIENHTVEHLPAAEPSLAEHLCRQLRLTTRDARTLDQAEWIVWNLAPDGYLREDLGELARSIGVTTADLERALTVVQSLDPIGVGARSLRECLLLQLRAQDRPDAIAIQLVDHHLKAVSEKRYADLARACGVPLLRIADAVAAVRRLEPRPGRPFGAPAQTIRPEAVIEKVGDDYRVMLANEDRPRVAVSRRAWATAAREKGDTRTYLAHRLRLSGRLVTAAEHRRETLAGVVACIVRYQREFLDHGPSHLRTLSLRQVARDIGVHDSTVSRAVSHRYVATPRGIFPLRFFFSNGIPGDPAGLVSGSAIRERIRDLVRGEDRACPLSDERIAHELATAGTRIARRTVVKYRALLGIAPSALRKSMSAETTAFLSACA